MSNLPVSRPKGQHAVVYESFSGSGRWSVRVSHPFNASAGGFLSKESAIKWAQERAESVEVI